MPVDSGGMQQVRIERMSVDDGAAIAANLASGAITPFILTDATGDWPATGKWTFDFFASEYGETMGYANLSFRDDTDGKLTKLRTFIEYLDRPLASLPGFWVGADGKPKLEEPEFDEARAWGFGWKPFKADRSLLCDVSPFPASVPNFAADSPADLYDIYERISGFDFHSIYITRRNTVTPLHQDHYNTFGSLVQFAGAKAVVMFAPDDHRRGAVPFDPEHPDFELYPEMRGATARSCTLAPGELLIIPPRWWHYTRSHDHSITLSHNFFNQYNLVPYMRAMFADLVACSGNAALFDKIGSILESSSRSEPRA